MDKHLHQMKQKSDKIVPSKKSSAVYKSSEWLLKSKEMKYGSIISDHHIITATTTA